LYFSDAFFIPGLAGALSLLPFLFKEVDVPEYNLFMSIMWSFATIMTFTYFGNYGYFVAPVCAMYVYLSMKYYIVKPNKEVVEHETN
jgi:hypothetical protein